MRVLIYEEWHRGHCFHYIHHILPQLLDEVDEVIVAMTPAGRDSPEFGSLLGPFADRVRFDTSLKPHNVFKRMSIAERLELLENFRGSVRRYRPDYVLSTTSDPLVKPLTLYQLMGRQAIPGRIPAEICLHGASKSPATAGARGRFKDATYSLSLRFNPARIHIVNTQAFEQLHAEGGALARRIALMPHPVPRVARLGKQECRKRLGLPEDGRYIGLVAEIDYRKAVAEMLVAFRAVATRPDDRMILAGRIVPDHRRRIEREYGDLLAEGRIILMDHFIDQATSDLVLQALDVVTTPYPNFPVLSSALLHGVAAGRPVLATDMGWMRMLIHRFGFGWTCDVTDHRSFGEGMARALAEAGDYVETEATRRLLEFHAPANFAACWLEGIRERLGRPQPERPTWPWVLDALDERRRSIA